MDFKYITEIKEAEEILENLKNERYLYLDTEVAVKDFEKIDFFNDKIRLIQIGTEKDIFIFDLFKIYNININQKLKEILETKGIIGHNLKFDIKFLKTNLDIFPTIVFDTMIASLILSEGEDQKHSLLAVSNRLANFDLDKSLQKSAWHTDILTQEQLIYAAKDIEALRNIFPILRERLNKIDKHKTSGKISEIFDLHNAVALVEMAFVPQVAMMELRGVYIDKERLKSMIKEASSNYQKSYIEFKTKYRIDPFSPQQVSNWIVNKLKIDLPKTEKGSFSSQDKYLIKYQDKPEIKNLLYIRSTKKILDKLNELQNYLKDSRIYGEFKQIGAPTGRMASLKPNLQNIPKDLRHLFTTPEGYSIITADYSQIELRLVAEYTKDENMVKAFKENKDLHKLTASIITGKNYEEITKEERNLAKAINFGLIYGISPKSLMDYASSNYGINITLAEANKFHKNFFEFYKDIKKWHEETKNHLNHQGYIVAKTLLGRRILAKKFTDAVNYPIQGSGSDLLKLAVVLFALEKKDLDAYIVNLIHDEIVIEVADKDIEKTKEALSISMEKAGKILLKEVPVAFEINLSKSWAK